MNDPENEEIEIRCLIKAMHLKYGYDFHGFSDTALKPRVLEFMADENIETISQLLHQVINDRVLFLSLVSKLTINVTQMFRNPAFYQILRSDLFEKFRDAQFVKIWLAGCSTGEEAHSVAIALKEEGLYDKSRIYATDISAPVLETAQQGIYNAGLIKDYTKNYIQAGGRGSFAQFYTAAYDHVLMDSSLRENISFAVHNLAADGSFGRMDMILCRNVLIYFTRRLQSRVLSLFYESLNDNGILCLGAGESVISLENADKFFKVLNAENRIYQKTGKKET